MRLPRSALALGAAGLMLAACGGTSMITHRAAPPASVRKAATVPSRSVRPGINPASVHANELGEIPVLMYHRIMPNPHGGSDQSPQHFRAELERLYRMDFRPITAAALVSGTIDLPAGTHPVVMTFDDSTPGQAAIGPDGTPNRDTALGILEEFGRSHPDFRPTATFYVNANPFGDPKVLPWLAAHGYEVGVHTVHHADLSHLDDAGVQQEITDNIAAIRAALPPGYPVSTMALPFGIYPTNAELAHRGGSAGQGYDLAGVMQIGSRPSASPYSSAFAPYAIPRIRSGPGGRHLDAGYWLDWFRTHPSALYTSAGDRQRVSFPANERTQIATAYAPRANPYGTA